MFSAVGPAGVSAPGSAVGSAVGPAVGSAVGSAAGSAVGSALGRGLGDGPGAGGFPAGGRSQGGRRGGAQGRQEGRHGGLVAQRDVVPVHLHGHARRGQRAAHAGERAAAGAHQDGHVAPGHPVLQMGAAQDVRDVVELGARGRVRVHLHAPALADGRQLPVGAHGGRREAGERHPMGDQAGGREEGGARAAGGGEDLDRRRCAVPPAEGARELEDAAHVGAAEGVDRLVRVAEGDQRPAVARKRAQQPQLGHVRVLVLVDEDGVVARGQLRRHLRPLGEQHRPVDQLRVVQHALRVQHVQVLGEEGRRRAPVRPPLPRREVPQRPRVEPQLPAAREHGAHLVGEAAGGQAGAQLVRPADRGATLPLQLRLSGEQLTDHDVLLGARQQTQRIGENVHVLVGANQGITE